jgi:prophage regulatory protein
MALKFHRIGEVCQMTGLRPSSVYKQIRLGRFPAGIKLTNRSTGWSSEQLEEWLRAKVNGEAKK